MTKAEIINKIAEDTGLPKKDVAATVEAFMEEIRDCMAVRKENVYLLSSLPRASLQRCNNLTFKYLNNLVLCQTERRRRATRWLLTSVRRDCARIVIRASKL